MLREFTQCVIDHCIRDKGSLDQKDQLTVLSQVRHLNTIVFWNQTQLKLKKETVQAKLLQLVDDHLINRRNIPVSTEREKYLMLKHHLAERELLFKDSIPSVTWTILEITNGILYLETSIAAPVRLLASIDGGRKPTILFASQFGNIYKLEVSLDLYGECSLRFFLVYNYTLFELEFSLGLFSHLPPTKMGYYCAGKYLLKANSRSIRILFTTKLRHIVSEIRYLGNLLVRGKLSLILYRLAYYWCRGKCHLVDI